MKVGPDFGPVDATRFGDFPGAPQRLGRFLSRTLALGTELARQALCQDEANGVADNEGFGPDLNHASKSAGRAVGV